MRSRIRNTCGALPDRRATSWSGVSPVLVYNLLVMVGFALSGLAMSLVMLRWTGSLAAGLVAGVLFAFNAHVLTRFAHLQALHVGFFPLMLYAFDRVLGGGVHPRPNSSAFAMRTLLSAAFGLQALSSNYLMALWRPSPPARRSPC